MVKVYFTMSSGSGIFKQARCTLHKDHKLETYLLRSIDGRFVAQYKSADDLDSLVLPA